MKSLPCPACGTGVTTAEQLRKLADRYMAAFDIDPPTAKDSDLEYIFEHTEGQQPFPAMQLLSPGTQVCCGDYAHFHINSVQISTGNVVRYELIHWKDEKRETLWVNAGEITAYYDETGKVEFTPGHDRAPAFMTIGFKGKPNEKP